MKPHEIKDLRLEKKLSQTDLGGICGVGKSAVSNWEKGKATPSGAALLRLEDLKNEKIVVSEFTELEARLLDENISKSPYKDREQFLTESLKHIIMHGRFLSVTEPETNFKPLALVENDKKANIMAAAGSGIQAEVIDWDGADDTVNVNIYGLSMLGTFDDGDVITMRHKKASRSPYMKKGLIYLIEYDGGYMTKEYNTRKPTADEKGADYIDRGVVKILKSHNPDKSQFPDIIITQEVEWFAWYEGK